MGKFRALHMPLANNCSGVTQYVLEHWQFINKERFIFDFATRSSVLDFEDKLVVQGCKVHRYSVNSLTCPHVFKQELNTIMDNGYDAVHLHTSYWNGTIAEEVAMELKIPKIIVHSHNTGVLSNEENWASLNAKHEEIKASFAADYKKLATDLWACSSLAADWLFDSSIPRPEIKILHNGIDTQKFAYNLAMRQSIREKLGLTDAFVIGHVGRFAYQKNHEFLIRAFSLFAGKCSKARLILIGDGELLDGTKALVQQYGLHEKVLFLGRRDDVANLMQAMDVFALPSRFEGLGTVLVEAQASGLHCMVSDKIPVEANITQKLKYLPLSETLWCSELMELSKKCERYNGVNLVKFAGYDVKDSASKLEQLYLN